MLRYPNLLSGYYDILLREKAHSILDAETIAEFIKLFLPRRTRGFAFFLAVKNPANGTVKISMQENL